MISLQHRKLSIEQREEFRREWISLYYGMPADESEPHDEIEAECSDQESTRIYTVISRLALAFAIAILAGAVALAVRMVGLQPM